MAKNFVFTITTGRSGTGYLAELLKSNLHHADVYHEILHLLDFGVKTPEVSTLTYFNTLGNVKKIRDFWQKKLSEIKADSEQTYVETSHVLAKAGLMENLNLLWDDPENQVHIVILKRDVVDIAWSMLNRFDMKTFATKLLFYLDITYSNVILNNKNINESDGNHIALWYIHEMYTRAAYYQLLYQDVPNLHFHEVNLKDIVTIDGATQLLQALALPVNPEVTLPGKVNKQTTFFYNETVKEKLSKLSAQVEVDHKACAQKYIDSGQTLSEPKHIREAFQKAGFSWED